LDIPDEKASVLSDLRFKDLSYATEELRNIHMGNKMSAILKTRDSSVLDEFEIPEHLGELVEDLKKEQQTIQHELEAVKARPVARQQDESTKIFNIRQHQMELKIAELEAKKKSSEKELQSILQQKNSSLHDDLKKLAQFILQETKKFAPLEKELNSKLSSVLNLRNELEHLFHTNLSDRKKNMGLIEDQNTYIHQLGDLIRETSKLLQSDFHFLTIDIQKIQTEKQEETKKLAEIKNEVAHHKALHLEVESRKKELRHLEHEISRGEKNALAFSRTDEELVKLRTELEELQEEKERLHESNIRCQQEEFHGQKSLDRLRLREKHLDHVLAEKKEQYQTLEADILDVRKRLELTKDEEHEIHSKYLHQRDQYTTLLNEISRMEGSRSSYLTMADDAQKMFEEKKGFFQRELETLEKLHASRIAEFTARAENEKTLWEEEFRVYKEARKSDLKRELEEIERLDLEDIRKKKTDLLKEVSQIMGSVLAEEGFNSSEERTKKARDEVEKSFQHVFGKTRRWKFW
jgi:hypothetical protein